MIDPYQFYEARAIGADAVLLIAAILDDVQMHGFYQLAGRLGLDALVEVRRGGDGAGVKAGCKDHRRQ